MKKTLIIFTSLIFSACSSIKTEVGILRDKTNTLSIPIGLDNTLNVMAILDTGCSDVSIPPYIAYTLFAEGKISEKQYLPSRKYLLANGSVVTCPRFLLKELKIGSFVLKDVACSISESNSSKILIGQSVLGLFKVVRIDNENDKLILFL